MLTNKKLRSSRRPTRQAAQKSRRRLLIEGLEVRRLLTTYLVDTLTDTMAEDGLLSLREAIEASSTDQPRNEAPAGERFDEIRFAPSLFEEPQTLTLTGGPLELLRIQPLPDVTDLSYGTVSIVGPGEGLLEIDANGFGHAFIVSGTATIADLTISGSDHSAITSKVSTNVKVSGHEGRTFNHAASIEIVNAVIEDNTGRAVRLFDGSLTIRDSTLRNNGGEQSPGYGGALLLRALPKVGENGGPVFPNTGSGIDPMTSPVAVIEDSLIIGNQSRYGGGGIANDGGTLAFIGSTVQDNLSASGAGILSRGVGQELTQNETPIQGTIARTQIAESRFINNQASGDESGGGGIRSENAYLSIVDSVFDGNSALLAAGGGLSIDTSPSSQRTQDGIAGQPTASVTGSTFTNNQAISGGAIENDNSQLTIQGTGIVSNQASHVGGGIWNYGEPGAVYLTIANTTISMNEAAQGGGVDHSVASGDKLEENLLLINATVTGNRSTGDGAGIAISDPGSAVTHSTTLINTLVVGNINATSALADDILGPVNESSHHNLVGNPLTAGGLVDGVRGNLIGNAGESWAAERILFVDPVSNLGGQTSVHSLKLDSPAIDAGTRNVPSVDGRRLIEDQRGYPFQRVDGVQPDMGAFESQSRPIFRSSELVVSTLEDELDGDYSTGDLSLREAVSLANRSSDVNGIRFSPNLFNTDESVDLAFEEIIIDPQLGPIEILWDLNLSGPGADLLGITTPTAANTEASRLFEIGPLATVAITKLFISHADGDPVTKDFGAFAEMQVEGGGIFNAGVLHLEDVRMFGNRSSTSGGAIHNIGELFVFNSVIESGAADDGGGGIFSSGSAIIGPGNLIQYNVSGDHGGGIANAGEMQIIDSVVYFNEGQNQGGGISNIAPSQYGNDSTRLEIRRSSITHNLTRQFGGGISSRSAELLIFDSELNFNRALREQAQDRDIAGGGIYVETFGAQFHLERSTLDSNTVDGTRVNADVSAVVNAFGGGIALVGGELEGTTTPPAEIISTTVSGNRAMTDGKNVTPNNYGDGLVAGGGIYVDGSYFQQFAPLIADSTIAHNQTQRFTDSVWTGERQLPDDENWVGAGIFVDNSVQMSNTLVTGNNSILTGQVYRTPSGSEADPITIETSTDVHINGETFGPWIGGASVREVTENLISSLTGNSAGYIHDFGGTAATPVTTTAPDGIQIVSELGTRLGGRTPTHALVPLSDAIDNGQRQGLVDQRGYPVTRQEDSFFASRQSDGEFGDIGAFESSQVTVIPFEAETLGASQFSEGDAFLVGVGFDDGRGDDSISKEPGFLGFEFDKTISVGPGIDEGTGLGDRWGADAEAHVDGRIGIEYGYYVNSGSVDTSYEGLLAYTVDQSSANEFIINPSATLTDGSLYTLSPRFGAYADIVFEFNASIGGTACVVGCISDEIGFGVDINQQLFAINRDFNNDIEFGSSPSSALFENSADDEVEEAGGLLNYIYETRDARRAAEVVLEKLNKKSKEQIVEGIGETKDLLDEIKDKVDDIRKNKGKEANASKKKSDAPKAGGGVGLTVDVSKLEGSLLGGEVEFGVGASFGPLVGVSQDIGSIAISLPEVALRDTELDIASGVLEASTRDFRVGSEEDASRHLASFSVNMAAAAKAAPGLGIAVPFWAGTFNMNAGPIEVSGTTIDYEITPRLAVRQDVMVEPSLQSTFRFDGFTGTIDVNGQSVSSGDSVAIATGELLVVNTGGKSGIDVTPEVQVINRFTNDVGLDIDVQGILKVLAFQLNAFGEKLFSAGPLYKLEHTLLDSYDLGSLWKDTFNLPNSHPKQSMPSFTLGQESGPSIDGETPASAYPLQPEGLPVRANPVAGTTYYSVPLLDGDGKLQPDVRFESDGAGVTFIRPPYNGLILDILDDDGLVLSSFSIEDEGVRFAAADAPTHFRLRGFENLYGSVGYFGVEFAEDANPNIQVQTEGNGRVTPLGFDFSAVRTAERQRQDESQTNAFLTDNDGAFDIDGDGQILATTDGLLVARFIDDPAQPPKISDAIAKESTRTTSQLVYAHLQNLAQRGRLDVDDDGEVTADEDAILILRHLAGIGLSATDEQALTNGINLVGSNRTLPYDIAAFIDGGRGPEPDQTAPVLSQSPRNASNRFQVSPTAVAGSSPFAPVLYEVVDGSGTASLPLGTTVAFQENVFTTSQDEQVLVSVRAEGSPAQLVERADELASLMRNPDLDTIDLLSQRLSQTTVDRVLGIEHPIYVRLPDAAGYELSLPSGTTVSELRFDANVGAAALLDHSFERDGTDVDFDLYVPATGEWFEVSVNEPFYFDGAAVGSFQLFPRAFPNPILVDPRNQFENTLDFDVGLVLSGTPQPVDLKVDILADRQDDNNLNDIFHTDTSGNSTGAEFRVRRQGAFVDLHVNDQPQALTSESALASRVNVANDNSGALIDAGEAIADGIQAGGWSTLEDDSAFGGDYEFVTATAFYFAGTTDWQDASTSWRYNGQPGEYEVYATWPVTENSRPVEFDVIGGSFAHPDHVVLQDILIKQNSQPNGAQIIDGIPFQKIAEVVSVDGELTVVMEVRAFQLATKRPSFVANPASADALLFRRVDKTVEATLVESNAFNGQALDLRFPSHLPGKSHVTIEVNGLLGEQTTDTFSVVIDELAADTSSVVQPIADQRIPLNSNSTNIDLDGVFAGSNLELSFELDHPNVSGSLDGTQLTVEFASDRDIDQVKVFVKALDSSREVIVGTDTFFIQRSDLPMANLVQRPVADVLRKPLQQTPMTLELTGRYGDAGPLTYASLTTPEHFNLRPIEIVGVYDQVDTLILDASGGTLYHPLKFAGGNLSSGGFDFNDEIQFVGSGIRIDLKQSLVTGVGTFDIRGDGPNELVLDTGSMIANAGFQSGQVRIIADSDDTVTLLNESEWTQDSQQQTIDGISYDVYRTNFFYLTSTPHQIQLLISDANTPAADPNPGPLASFPASTMNAVFVNELISPGQVATLTSNRDSVMQDDFFEITMNYELDGSGTAIPPSALFEVHYDSSKVRFDGVESVLGTGLVNHPDLAPQVESILDQSLRTDRTIVLSWSDFIGDWSTGSASVELATLRFQYVASDGIARFRTTGAPAANFRVDLDAARVNVSYDDGETPSQYVVTTLTDVVDGSDSVLSLREAVTLANQDSGEDSIVFAPSLTVGGAATIAITQGDLLITDSVTIQGPGANVLTIDALGNSRLFDLSASAGDVTIQDMTLTGGQSPSGESGGAIRSFVSGTLTISDSVISGNTAEKDGGGVSSHGGLLVINSTIAGNNASNGGGGISHRNTTGQADLIASTINGNQSAFGGGIMNFNASMNVLNSTISGNSTSSLGGGIVNVSDEAGNVARMRILQSTITQNTTGAGGAVHSGTQRGATFGEIEIGNTLIVQQIDGDDVTLFDQANSSGATITSLGHNLADGFATGLTATGDRTDITIDVVETALANNGGKTETHRLLADSPAIDAGDPTLLPANLTADQRGETRIFGNTVDIGAFELGAALPPSYSVADLSSTVIAESGTQATFRVVLNAPPLRDVVFDITSDDTSEASVSPASLTFTSSNWNTAQTVTITGVDDAIDDGSQSTTVTVSVNAAASDDAYTTLAAQTVTVSTTDNDVQPVDAVVSFELEITDLDGNPIARNEVSIGDEFRLNAIVNDLRGSAAEGVFTAHLDVAYTNSSAFSVIASERQRLVFTPETTGGSFWMTFQGTTAPPITFSSDIENVADDLRQSLETHPDIGTGNVRVVGYEKLFSYELEIIFINDLAEMDLPTLEVDWSRLIASSGSPAVTVQTIANADRTEANWFRDVFIPGPLFPDGFQAEEGDGTDLNVFSDVGSYTNGRVDRDLLVSGLLWSVDLRAISTGAIAFTGGPAEDPFGQSILLFPLEIIDPTQDVAYGSTQITIVDGNQLMPGETQVTLEGGNVVTRNSGNVIRTIARDSIQELDFVGSDQDETLALDELELRNDVAVFIEFDGRGGVDTFRLLGEAQTLDLSSVATISLQNVEFIDISGRASNSLKMSESDIASLPDDGQMLHVMMDVDDTLEISDGDFKINDALVANGRFYVEAQSSSGTTLRITGTGWTNPLERLDVNADRHITAVDALQVINALNRDRLLQPGSNSVLIDPKDQTAPFSLSFIDVTADGNLAPLDALRVINYLNRRVSDPESSGESYDASIAAPPMADSNSPEPPTRSSWLERDSIETLSETLERMSPAKPIARTHSVALQAIGNEGVLDPTPDSDPKELSETKHLDALDEVFALLF